MLPFSLQGSVCSFFINENNEDLISLKIARFVSNYQSIGLMSPLNKPQHSTNQTPKIIKYREFIFDAVTAPHKKTTPNNA